MQRGGWPRAINAEDGVGAICTGDERRPVGAETENFVRARGDAR